MKKIIIKIRRYYYRRLYRKLFMLYAKRGMGAYEAAENASYAFECLNAFEYTEVFKHSPMPAL